MSRLPEIDRTRMLAVARKEVIQLRRDRRSLLLAFFLPLLLLVIFGYAITWDIAAIPTAIVDSDRSPRSRELIDAFRASGYFRIEAMRDDGDAVGDLIDRGAVQFALIIPSGLASDLDAGRAVSLQAIVDGSDANTATIVLGYARAIVQSHSLRTDGWSERRSLPISVESRVWYNEDLKSRNMIVPGLVAVIMMIIAAMLTSLTIAREWERGTMEQLASTPVSKLEVVLGKLLPYLAIGIVDVAASSILGVSLFGVPFRGSLLLFAVLSLFFLIGALGLGMFISAIARSQLVATQMAMIVTFLPAYLLSGFMFSIDAMPAALRFVTFLVPARYFLVVTRGIFLKGVGVPVLYSQGLSMVLFAAIGIVLAVRAFKKELPA